MLPLLRTQRYITEREGRVHTEVFSCAAENTCCGGYTRFSALVLVRCAARRAAGAAPIELVALSMWKGSGGLGTWWKKIATLGKLFCNFYFLKPPGTNFSLLLSTGWIPLLPPRAYSYTIISISLYLSLSLSLSSLFFCRRRREREREAKNKRY